MPHDKRLPAMRVQHRRDARIKAVESGGEPAVVGRIVLPVAGIHIHHGTIHVGSYHLGVLHRAPGMRVDLRGTSRAMAVGADNELYAVGVVEYLYAWIIGPHLVDNCRLKPDIADAEISLALAEIDEMGHARLIALGVGAARQETLYIHLVARNLFKKILLRRDAHRDHGLVGTLLPARGHAHHHSGHDRHEKYIYNVTFHLRVCFYSDDANIALFSFVYNF